MTLVSGNDGVAGDKLGHSSTSGLNTKGEGFDINKNDVTERLVAGENTALDSGTVGNSLVRVDTLRGLLVEVLLEELLDLGDTSRTSNKNDLAVALVIAFQTI